MKGYGNIGKNLGAKALPALGGGALARIFDSYVSKQVVEMLPDSVKPYSTTITGLLPGIAGLFLLDNKNTSIQFVGAGMLGASGYIVAGSALGLGDDVLADAAEELDELFDGMYDDMYSTDDDDDSDTDENT